MRRRIETDLDKFTDAFIDYAVAVYESRLSKYRVKPSK
jgi:ABC-type transporter MlaC component